MQILRNNSYAILDNKINSYLSDCEIKHVQKTIKKNCDSFPSLKECIDAVVNLKSNKSPGLDGIPNEFYLFFGKIYLPYSIV